MKPWDFKDSMRLQNGFGPNLQEKSQKKVCIGCCGGCYVGEVTNDSLDAFEPPGALNTVSALG